MNKPILSKHIPQDEHINTVAAIFLLSALPQNVVRAEHDSGCARTQFWYTSLGRTRPEHSELTKEIHPWINVSTCKVESFFALTNNYYYLL